MRFFVVKASSVHCRFDAVWRAMFLLFAALSLAAGETQAQVITEFKSGMTAGASPQGIAAGPDGNVWFTERLKDKIGVITPAGAISEFSVGITSGAAPANIVLGIDGNMWFKEASGNRIGRITPSGSVAEFAIPPPAGEPYGIALGADGNIWFTAATNTSPSGAVGRILTSSPHTVTIFHTGISDDNPYSITPGPDGALWFTEPESAKIGRITVTGSVTEFPTGLTAGNNLSVIVTGPDGNLWFASSGDKTIARMTTSGTVTPFTAGITGNPVGIAAGPDGNLWFTDGNAIGRITTSGTVTEFTMNITPGAAPTFITAGPDSNMWFSEDVGDSIGRITVSTGPPTPVFQSAVSRKVHGAAGTFDLSLSLVPTDPTTEPRLGPIQTIVFTFDSPVTAANAVVMEGVAVAGAPSFNGNEVTVGLTRVADRQYVTVALTDIDGTGNGGASVRIGFLMGDVSQNRVVTVSDVGLANAEVTRPVTLTNFLKDINANGVMTVSDKGLANSAVTHVLPPP